MLNSDIKKYIYAALKSNSIVWTSHCMARMLQRNISREEVIVCLGHGKIIERYDDDKPLKSCLLCGKINNRFLHLVIGYSANDICIVTVYEPSSNMFKDDFTKRR